jgi:hypothetical protein
MKTGAAISAPGLVLRRSAVLRMETYRFSARADLSSQCVAAMGSAPAFYAFGIKTYPAKALPWTCQEEQVPPGLPRSRSLANWRCALSYFYYCFFYCAKFPFTGSFK